MALGEYLMAIHSTLSTCLIVHFWIQHKEMMIKQSMLPTAIFLTNKATKVVLKCRIYIFKNVCSLIFLATLGCCLPECKGSSETVVKIAYFTRGLAKQIWYKKSTRKFLVKTKSSVFFCFKLIIICCHTQKQKKIKFKPRIKLTHNSSNWPANT